MNAFHDVSGLITVSVFSRVFSPPQPHWTNREVLVGDDDMVAIGGGGTASRFSTGALLTASYPNDAHTGWIVSSKDHQVGCMHNLSAYVVGLKIAGMSRRDMVDSLSITKADSAVAHHPEATVAVPSDDHVLIGGGFNVHWNEEGSLATASFPCSPSQWRARAKDHCLPDPSSLTVYALSLRKKLPVGTVEVHIGYRKSEIASQPLGAVSPPPGFALTGGGADVHWQGVGNLLWKLEPSIEKSQEFVAAAKDHLYASPCDLTVYALGIRIIT